METPRWLDPRAYARRLRRLYIDCSEASGLSKALQAWRGRRDLPRLHALHPPLRDYERLAAEAAQGFTKPYERYTAEISPDHMAVSFETCVFMTVICDLIQPRRILDLGSGFSSALFRLYRESADWEIDVVSADDSVEWLEATRNFLEDLGLPSDDLHTWEELKTKENGTFDLIFHDLGNLQARADALPDVVRLGHAGSTIVLDDVQSQFYRSSVGRFLRRPSVEFKSYCSLRALTVDSWGRYASLLVL